MIIDPDVLALVVVASAILAKVFETVKARIAFFWDKLTDEQREIGGLVFVAITGVLMWFTGLDMLPGFSTVTPPLGRVLTCVIAAFGPGAVYDMWMDKPQVPPK